MSSGTAGSRTPELPDAALPDAALPDAALPDAALPRYVHAVLEVVDQIPAGMVLSYGDIAEMLGNGGPRQVGSVLSRYGSAVTWWRVTRASGELPKDLQDEALAHWRAEGTPMAHSADVAAGPLTGGRVDMARARWDGTGDSAGRPGAGPGR